MDRTKQDWINDALLLGLVIIVSSFYLFLNIPHEVVHVLRTFIDDSIPRLPVFTIPYLLFLPWFWGIVFYAWYKNRNFKQLAYTIIIVNLIASVVYIMFQTYVPREVVISNDLFSNLLRMIYSNDQAYSGFPSLHSGLSAVIATYCVIRKSRFAWAAVVMAVLIVASTLFVKQHFILDAISGVTLGIATTWIVFKFSNKSNEIL